jgi:hypothetical protein
MATGNGRLDKSRVVGLIPCRMWIDKSMLGRDNDAILDRIFAVEYLLGDSTHHERHSNRSESPQPVSQ